VDTQQAPSSVDPPTAAAPSPPEEPVVDAVEAMVEIARREGEGERGVTITRCMMEQVQEFNGRDAAVSIVRAKRAQLANQPLPPGSMPVLAIMAQEAEDCAAQYDAAHTEAANKDAG
jgi:hypothetical protein